jgi:hypothetical protein
MLGFSPFQKPALHYAVGRASRFKTRRTDIGGICLTPKSRATAAATLRNDSPEPCS